MKKEIPAGIRARTKWGGPGCGEQAWGGPGWGEMTMAEPGWCDQGRASAWEAGTSATGKRMKFGDDHW